MTEPMTTRPTPGVTYHTAPGTNPRTAPDPTYDPAPRASHRTAPVGTHPTASGVTYRTAPVGTHSAAQRASPRAAPPARGSRTGRRPVFIDQSGRRRRLLQTAALSLGLVCLGYLLFVGTLVTGLWQPVGTVPPRMNGSVPSGPDRAGPVGGGGGPAHAHAHRPSGNAEAGHQRGRQPVQRAGAQAGGLKQ